MHVIAHRGVQTHVREYALKVDSGRKIPCRTGESNLRQRRDGPMLFQLSHMPTQVVRWMRRIRVPDYVELFMSVVCLKVCRRQVNVDTCLTHTLCHILVVVCFLFFYIALKLFNNNYHCYLLVETGLLLGSMIICSHMTVMKLSHSDSFLMRSFICGCG